MGKFPSAAQPRNISDDVTSVIQAFTDNSKHLNEFEVRTAQAVTDGISKRRELISKRQMDSKDLVIFCRRSLQKCLAHWKEQGRRSCAKDIRLALEELLSQLQSGRICINPEVMRLLSQDFQVVLRERRAALHRLNINTGSPTEESINIVGSADADDGYLTSEPITVKPAAQGLAKKNRASGRLVRAKK